MNRWRSWWRPSRTSTAASATAWPRSSCRRRSTRRAYAWRCRPLPERTGRTCGTPIRCPHWRPAKRCTRTRWPTVRACRPARRGWERSAVLVLEGGGRDDGSPLPVRRRRAGRGDGRVRPVPRRRSGTSRARGTVVLRDLEAGDPAGYAALWRVLFESDLTSTLVAQNRPVDDAWKHLVSDVRRCEWQLRDGLFARLVDVGAALEARTYRTPADVVREIEDSSYPWNEGRWRLTGDQGGASCTRTRAAADVALSVRTLASTYPGGVPLTALARAGRAGELRRGALGRALLTIGTDAAP
ncbi:sterol carrier protein domain-containing protein [Streptomyces sp. NPDC006514]|uniref:sterol carrier protein domain-containing protein n=1 Tax=Streptomyces sp. NPDC006514 TaxID=3154308 RepID=UPI0033BC0E2A